MSNSTNTSTTSTSASNPATGSQQQQSTQAYLQQHQIPRVLEDVVAKLARERPADPFTFLVSSRTTFNSSHARITLPHSAELRTLPHSHMPHLALLLLYCGNVVLSAGCAVQGSVRLLLFFLLLFFCVVLSRCCDRFHCFDLQAACGVCVGRSGIW